VRPLGRRTAVVNCSIAKRTALAGVAWAGILLVHGASAAVPVVESEGSVPGASTRGAPSRSASEARAYPTNDAATAYPASSDAQPYPVAAQAATPYPSTSGGSQLQSDRAPTSELFYQLQTLQTEVGELRGLVEEQRHLIERLQREQKEQYLDLDRRVAALTTQGVAPSAGSASAMGVSTEPSSGESAAPVSQGTSTAGERDAYTRAFNLTRDKRFQEAINAFNQLLVDYPNGEYAANSFYWLGELYLALPQAELEKARQSFAQVVNSYPSHAKVPDSLYKLGVVYHRLGDNRKALEYLTRTHTEYPASPAARLAQSYASEIR